MRRIDTDDGPRYESVEEWIREHKVRELNWSRSGQPLYVDAELYDRIWDWAADRSDQLGLDIINRGGDLIFYRRPILRREVVCA